LSLALEKGLGEAAADVVALPFTFFELPFSLTVVFFDWEGATGNDEDADVESWVVEIVDWAGGFGTEDNGAEGFGLDSMTTEGASLFTVGDGGTDVRVSSRYLACCC
jgi:hypothetical protein